ncbi:helix-turn-helix domain-containing protein [Clostridium butyricum]
MTNNFGENLRKYRKDKQMGINELGRHVGVSGAYISALETGKKVNPSLDIIGKLSNALEIPPSFLTSNDWKISFPVDMEQIKQAGNRMRTYLDFIRLLGYNIEIEIIDEDGNQSFFIDDIEYTSDQFYTLIEIIKTCIKNSNDLLKNK